MRKLTLGLSCLVLVVAACTPTEHRRRSTRYTEKLAEQFAQNLKPDDGTVTVQCADFDSDDDGYISCTVFVKAHGKVTPVGIECAAGYSHSINSTGGCKLPRG